MKRILMTGEGYTEEQLRRIRALGFDVTHEIEISPDKFHSLLPSIDAHILGGSEVLDAQAIARADRLRVVSFVGTGYGAFVDEEAARKRNILIMNTPEVMAQAVAEHTVGFLIGLVRGLFEQNAAVKRLESSPRTTTVELEGMTVGLLGMGAIGARIARILTTGFGCRVLYNSRTRKSACQTVVNGKELMKIFNLYRPALPFTPQDYALGSVLPAVLYMMRWGHRRGKGKFFDVFGNKATYSMLLNISPRILNTF